jgi:hypothetical protein
MTDQRKKSLNLNLERLHNAPSNNSAPRGGTAATGAVPRPTATTGEGFFSAAEAARGCVSPLGGAAK